MDPVSQGVLGATAALVFTKYEDKFKQAAFIGSAAGMAPDLDILFQSNQDPLLALELHRQFTHSLVFIPFGGLLVAELFWLLFYRKQSFMPLYGYAIAGFATHGLLDACTSYGTQLLWPFTNLRIAWDTIGIIDLFVTLPLLIGVVLTCTNKTKIWLAGAVLFFVAYMGLAVVQHHRAISVIMDLVKQEARETTRIKAMPTIGNIIVWRTLYETDERYYINAVTVPLFGKPRVYPGSAIDMLQMAEDFPEIAPNSTQFNDVLRFKWFTENWLAVDPNHPDRIADLRYSAQVEGVKPLWSIQVNSTLQEQHVKFLQGVPEGDRDIIPFDKIFDTAPSSK